MRILVFFLMLLSALTILYYGYSLGFAVGVEESQCILIYQGIGAECHKPWFDFRDKYDSTWMAKVYTL